MLWVVHLLGYFIPYLHPRNDYFISSELVTGGYLAFLIWVLSGYMLFRFAEEIRAHYLPLITGGLAISIVWLLLPQWSDRLQTLQIGGKFPFSFQALVSYYNPLPLLVAAFIFLLLQKVNGRSRIVNNIASTSLAVYIIHLNPSFTAVFQKYLSDYWNIGTTTTFWGLLIRGLVVGIICWAVCVIIELVRKVRPPYQLRATSCSKAQGLYGSTHLDSGQDISDDTPQP
jgi:hypothetical protein